MSMIRSLASHHGQNLRLLGGCVFRMHEHVGSHHQGILVLHQRRMYSVDQQSDHNQDQHNGGKRNKIKWALGSMLVLGTPFWNNEWKNFLKLEGEVEKAVETAAEVVEKVATVAEKVSSEIADRLPEDGKLKDAVLIIENVSKEAVEEAQRTKDIIHKVDELKEDVESFLEPVMGPEKHTG